jgi:hypothetical protein
MPQEIGLLREDGRLCENEPFMAKPYDLKMAVAKIRATINLARTKPS